MQRVGVKRHLMDDDNDAHNNECTSIANVTLPLSPPSLVLCCRFFFYLVSNKIVYTGRWAIEMA